ncbi:FxSxx-COOH system tetratricopeptide repeat protein [Streptomyces sp. NBC_00101]|uniref:FxSxx-COOH system tetratricopeptide repeat protein n=1 Tax=Streptomyces sp. NBC_00101 TaxID=2975651 RepID=UPI003255D14F
MPGISHPAPPGPFAVFFTTSESLGLSTTLRNVADVLAEGNRSVLLVNGRGPGRGDSGQVPDPVPGQVTTTARTTPDTLTGLARDPSALRYDHVLVEAPLPDAPGAVHPGALAEFADSLVICFALTAWSIDGAAALADDLDSHRGGRTVTMLTLGLRSDIGVRDRLRDARERVRRRFAPIAQARGETGLPFLEIPYNPLYMDSRSLVVESEVIGNVTGMRPYYERVADRLRALQPARLTDVVLVHAARHASWAAWIEDRLADRGVRTELRRGDTYAGERPAPGTALLFLSPRDADDALLRQIGALSHTDVRIVLVDEPVPHTEAAHHERIDLRDATEGDALRILCTALGLPPGPDRAGPGGAPYPRLPEVINIPPRNREFTGRDAVLTSLDEELWAAGREGACLVLHGAGGSGTSETARELCHRIGARYDLVWWVRAWEGERIRRELHQLAGRLSTTEELTGRAAPGDDDAAVARLLARLTRPEAGAGRWLIVYDGVTDPAGLRGLLPVPHERGHVLIATRREPVPEPASEPSAGAGGKGADRSAPRFVPFALAPMTPEEARLLLGDHLPDISADQALRVGSVTEFVPQALRLAAHCLAQRAALHRGVDHMGQDTANRAAVDDLLTLYRTHKSEMLAGAAAVSSVAVMVRVALEVARSTPGADAWKAENPAHEPLGWLLDAASLLTGRGMGLELLRSPRILSELARDDTAGPLPVDRSARDRTDDAHLPDEHMVSVALWSLAQVGLLEVDFDRRQQPLAQHHGLRDLIRAGMEPAAQQHVESVLRTTLAEYGPEKNQDLPADWAREVYSLRLWEDTRPRVRRSLLRHLHALSGRGENADLERVLDIAGRAREAWWTEGDEQSPEYLRLLNHTARAHRMRGDYADARRRSQEALRGHRRLLGPTHPRTLLSADSHAAILRALGRFDDALMELRPAMDGITLLLGDNHPATLQIEHNLALTEALTGRVAAATGRMQKRFRYRQAVGGEDDPVAWNSAELLAHLYRATGRAGESRDLLRRRLRRHGDTWDMTRLSTEVGLAVSERRLADARPANLDPVYGFEMAYERDQRALQLYVSRFGAERPETLRCRFSFAADLHALNKVDEAVRQAAQCGESLAARYGPGHPYTALNQVRQGVYLRAAGEPREAAELGRAALGLLVAKVGEGHFWVATAENSLAATLAADGRTGEAAALTLRALRRLRDLGVSHRPDGRRVQAHHARLTTGDTSVPEPRSGYDIDLELP